jgi:hypothetical protein
MRRLVISLTVVLVSLGAAAAPASAAPGQSLNRQVSGPFTGTSVFDSTPACSFFHQVYDATYTTKNARSGSFHLDGCVEFRSPVFAYSGSFVLTTPNRAILQGTVTGVVGGSAPADPCEAGFAASLDFTLVLTQGTKRFQGATGTIHLVGTWCSPTVPGVLGDISGTLAGALATR